MRGTHITERGEIDNRAVGISLIVIGSGWVSLQSVATELTGWTVLSMVAFGSAGIGTIHVVYGIYLLGNEYLGRQFSFPESVLIGAVSFVASSGVLVFWAFLQSGSVSVDAIVSFPVFVGYVAAWAFPLGFATVRRHRLYVIALLCAIPIAMLAAMPVLILAGGGWLFVIALFSIPVTLALIPLILLLALPILIAGWNVRSPHSEIAS